MHFAGSASGWMWFFSPNPPPQNTLLVQHPQNAFTLYNADLNKDYYIGKFTKGGWDISYWGGDQLDRFSRYFPSFLSSPRLHGIPPGTDSFDAIAMANVHYGFNVMDFMKIDGMYAYARARNEKSRSNSASSTAWRLTSTPLVPWARWCKAQFPTRWTGISRATTPVGPLIS